MYENVNAIIVPCILCKIRYDFRSGRRARIFLSRDKRNSSRRCYANAYFKYSIRRKVDCYRGSYRFSFFFSLFLSLSRKTLLIRFFLRHRLIFFILYFFLRHITAITVQFVPVFVFFFFYFAFFPISM